MKERSTYTPAYTQTPSAPCLICAEPLEVRLARGRKSAKPSVMLVCPTDGRHFRAFITDQAYVRKVLDQLEETA